MITFKHFFKEALEKNKWTHLLSNDAEEYSFDLLSIVQNAYKNTTLGAFVKSIHDVKGSDWLALDYDYNPDVDVAIFFRSPRSNEVWKGYKIQGIGHDSSPEAKDKAIRKLISTLDQSGWWIEASGAVAKALLKRDVEPVRDEELLKKLFPKIEQFKEDGSYVRPGPPSAQFVFGNPLVD